MITRIGINGFGRIGRTIFRESQKRHDIEVVAINDLSNIEYIKYMLKYDSTHGIFKKDIRINGDYLIINKKNILCTSEKNISNINWKDVNVDVVIESTGINLDYKSSYLHILSGARKVIITAVPKDNNIPMYVFGVNHKEYKEQKIISNASCTTNCLAPIVKIIQENFGIEEGLMTTVHAVTSTQKTVDGISLRDWRGGRSAFQNIIPSSTGAATAVGKIIPELQGKLTGMSLRVPVSNVSVTDFTVRLKKSSSAENICQKIKEYANNKLNGIIGYTNENVVSSDFNGNNLISIFDEKASIFLNKKFVKLISWYDNETGYSSKVLDLANYICNKT